MTGTVGLCLLLTSVSPAQELRAVDRGPAPALPAAPFPAKIQLGLEASERPTSTRLPLRALPVAEAQQDQNGLSVIPFRPTTEIDPREAGSEAAASAPRAEKSLFERSSAEAATRSAIDEAVLSRGFSRPEVNVEGLGNADNLAVYGSRFVPPDPVGDVGPNHYVQMVNILLEVFDKDGTSLAGPLPFGLLWPFGHVCNLNHLGDPIVLYDHLADRWFLSELAFRFDGAGNPIGPFYQCIAVSQTSDPTGGYYLYDFVISPTKVNDYPKFGLWPDGYYATWNHFDSESDFAFTGVGVGVFERQAMLAGEPARLIYGEIPAVLGAHSLLPSDLDGPPPAPGTPNVLVQINDDDLFDSADGLLTVPVSVDWTLPSGSTGAPSFLAVEPFDGLLPFLCGVGQPSPGEFLDPISDRLLHRAAYRDFGGHASLLVTHTIAAQTSFCGVGKRWYEIRFPGGAPTIHQHGTHSPSYQERWMGSIAMDREGNVALGYSVAGTETFPSIRTTGRLAGDPRGTLPQGELEIVAGSGAQVGGAGRWGDYSAMSVDPSDGCSFWYTQQYYRSDGNDWRTRIASFAFPSCTDGPSGGLAGTVIDAASGEPIAFASVSAGEHTTRTDPSGHYLFQTLPAGTHAVSVSSFGHDPETVDGLSVQAGETVTQDVALAPRGLWEDFDGGSPRTAVTVIDNAGTGAVWRFDNPGARTNLTGGSGSFAIADSDFAGPVAVDTELRLPSIDLSGLEKVTLEFDSDFNHFAFSNDEVADVDVSLDGGATWQNVWRREGGDFLGPSHEMVDLSPLAVGESDVRIRFHYHNAFFEWWWQLDNILVTGSGAPIVTSGEASEIGETSAILNGAVNPRGEATSYFFEWGETAEYTEQTEARAAGAGHAERAVSAALAGLAPGTTYHFRLVAENDAGTAEGADQTFTTAAPAPSPPAPPPPPPEEPPRLPPEEPAEPKPPGEVRGTQIVRLTGTRKADLLRGTGGDDLIRARAGADTIRAGPGADRVFGGRGPDRIFGGRGNDLLFGGKGKDMIRAKKGDDRIGVRDGHRDHVYCGAGDDLVIADSFDWIAKNCETVRRP